MTGQFEKHVFVCVNDRGDNSPKGSCGRKGGMEVFLELHKQVKARKLKEKIRLSKATCLAACELGVTIVIYPEGVWYKQVKVSDVVRIVDEHLCNDKVVESLNMYA